MAPIIIDNEVKLKVLLAHIAECVRVEQDQLLFIDLEGVNLSRLGAVAILQLLMPPSPTVYLIDVHVLGAKAFKVAMNDNTTLKSVLESKTIFKVFFDVRNDSDALHAHFGVNIAGVIDLQIIEYATRQPRGKFVNGLARCIERDLPYSSEWSRIKANGRRLFAPEVGGKYEVFLERPLPVDIVKYCEQDVILMPRLLASYGPKLRSGVAAQIQTIVDERLHLSKTSTFNGQGRHMAIGPYLAAER
jgi:exonuclease 3'-5' domain-containing protein 1